MNIHIIYRLVGAFFRSKRMTQFATTFKVRANHQILDVGGTEFNWTLLDEKPHVYFVNIVASKSSSNWIVADGCALPFRNGAFDIVFSNSVIEHLGTYKNQKRFADECRRVGKQYYIQTPNRWFFIEPHMLTPFIHWLPKKWQLHLLRNFTLRGLLLRPTPAENQALLDEIRLMDKREIRELFPEAEIWEEKFLGFTKSFVAVYKSGRPNVE